MTKYGNKLPEWSWPYTDCYTGPNWSDGKWQASVANGECPPKSKLDVLSKRHDRVYALDPSDVGRDASDLAYFQGTRRMSYAPRIFGDAVLIGNAIGRRSTKNLSFGNLLSVAADVVSLSNPLSLVVSSMTNYAMANKPNVDKSVTPPGGVLPKLRGSVQEWGVCDATRTPMTDSIVGKPPGWRPPQAVGNFPSRDGANFGNKIATHDGLGDAGDTYGKDGTDNGLQRGADGRLNATQRYAAFYQCNINERLDRFHRKLYKNKRRRKTRVYCC